VTSLVAFFRVLATPLGKEFFLNHNGIAYYAQDWQLDLHDLSKDIIKRLETPLVLLVENMENRDKISIEILQHIGPLLPVAFIYHWHTNRGKNLQTLELYNTHATKIPTLLLQLKKGGVTESKIEDEDTSMTEYAKRQYNFERTCAMYFIKNKCNENENHSSEDGLWMEEQAEILQVINNNSTSMTHLRMKLVVQDRGANRLIYY
jgi:hypothetical protein